MALIPPQRLQLQQLRVAVNRVRRNYVNLIAILVAAEQQERQRLRRRRRWWVRPWILRRPLYGQYEQLMGELEREAQGDFKSFLRMEPAMFHELLQRLTPALSKNNECVLIRSDIILIIVALFNFKSYINVF